MAITTTCFYLKNVHPAAGPYYLQFPSEPIPRARSDDYLTVAPPVALTDNLATAVLAEIAAKVPKKGSVLLVCHGTDKNIKLRIGKGEDDVLQAEALQVLRENVEKKLDDAEAARRLKFPGATAGDPTGVVRLNALKAAMARVQALELRRIDLRACNTGRNTDTLKRLQWFFNADLCCAPDSWDAFGPLPSPAYTRNPRDWRDFLKKHPANSMIDDGTRRYALGYTLGGRTMLSAMATDPEAVNPWAEKYLPPKLTSTGVAAGYYGLTRDMKHLIFPGEPEYRDRLVSVTAGKGSTIVKVDANDALPPPRQLP